jgi:hypothetical protein
MNEDKNDERNLGDPMHDDTEWIIMDLLDDNGAHCEFQFSFLC